MTTQQADLPARKHYMLRGPQYAPYTTSHELGHATSITPMNHDAYLAHFTAIHLRGVRINDKPLEDYSEKNGTAAKKDFCRRYKN